MPPDPEPENAPRAVSSLDYRIRAVTGHDTDTLWSLRDRGLLDEPHAELVDRHRELAAAETRLIFCCTLLHRLAGGEFPVEAALFESIDRTVDQLEEAADTRDAAARRVMTALEPIETAADAAADGLTAAHHAALLALAGGATLRLHLLTGQVSVTTASGTRIPLNELQHLEKAGHVSYDTRHSAHTGQPVALTGAGRTALAAARRPPTTQAPATAAGRPGARTSTPAQRR
ncbi:hypothetical protein ACFCXP_16955 [Streptomyces niveus]|uniref:hypothetical protein n=1 Tax=Streptomyces niveus TaxID=193462 RepID=UPI0035E21523